MRRRRTQKPNYAFIDSQNLNLGTQKVGFKMDWRKFRIWLKDNYNVDKAFMFIGYMAENEALYEQLHEQGYLIALKPTVDIQQHDADGKEEPVTVKGNIDADLVLHAMKELPNYGKAIIVSGDGDFFGLVEYLAEQKKLLHVMTPNWQYSSLLKQFDDYVVRLDERRKELAYRDHKGRSGPTNAQKPKAD